MATESKKRTKTSTSWKVIYNAPKELQPRERVKAVSSEEELRRIPDEVLLANILRVGVPGSNVLQSAVRLREKCDGLSELAKYPTVRSLLAFLHEKGIGNIGIGPDKAAEIISSVEIGRRIAVELRERVARRCSLLRVEDRVRLFRHLAAGLDQEKFWVVLLDERKRMVYDHAIELTRGSSEETIARPRDVFKDAVREGASLIVVAHNHISENVEPSEDDEMLTNALSEAGEVMGIAVMDHVIVSSVLGCENYYSFAEGGCCAAR